MVTFSNLQDIKHVNFDHIIVGSGAAGTTLATRLTADTAKKVLLLEAGFEAYEERSQEVYEGQVGPGLLHADLSTYRMRQLGGSTNCWGGGCLPFDRRDFLPSALGSPGWPISLDDLKPYYAQAGDFLAVGEFYTGKETKNILNLGYANPTEFEEKYWRVNDSKKVFAERYDDLFRSKPNLKICLESNVIGIEFDEGNQVRWILVADYRGNLTKVGGENIILACGGIEVTRLLLNWAEKYRHFNGFKQHLGRYYSPHINLDNGIIASENGVSFQNDYQEVGNGVEERKFLSFSEATALKNKLLNSKINFSRYQLPGGMRNRFGDIMRYLSGRSASKLYRVFTTFDQTPTSSSTISLSKNKDKFGLRRAIVKHEIAKEDVAALRRHYELFARVVGFYKLGRFQYQPVEEVLWDQEIGRSHHTGTTRMGVSSADGVVDKNLKVFGTENLYICSSSVFVTPSQANPTFTIAALALRLGDYLGKVK